MPLTGFSADRQVTSWYLAASARLRAAALDRERDRAGGGWGRGTVEESRRVHMASLFLRHHGSRSPPCQCAPSAQKRYAMAKPIWATNIIRYMWAQDTWFASTASSSGRRSIR